VLMIVKGLCRRYERWNPVHPTSGAFWGMGVGVGCGVGWGPGFGPEVIGYVGAGCGVGFSVGITLAGFGIGLPANWLFEVPFNAFMATRTGALAIAHSRGLHNMRKITRDGWSNIGPHVSGLQKEASERFLSFKHEHSLDKFLDFPDMNSRIASQSRCILDHIGKFRSRFIVPRK
ncbi:hypothetical protein RJ639_030412, partial [Escallonia herrerae]